MSNNRNKTAIIKRCVCTAPNTERIIDISSNAVFALQIGAQNSTAALRLAFDSGKVSTAESAHWCIRAGEVFKQDDLHLTGRKIYVATATGAATTVVQAIVFV